MPVEVKPLDCLLCLYALDGWKATLITLVRPFHFECLPIGAKTWDSLEHQSMPGNGEGKTGTKK